MYYPNVFRLDIEKDLINCIDDIYIAYIEIDRNNGKQKAFFFPNDWK